MTNKSGERIELYLNDNDGSTLVKTLFTKCQRTKSMISVSSQRLKREKLKLDGESNVKDVESRNKAGRVRAFNRDRKNKSRAINSPRYKHD